MGESSGKPDSSVKKHFGEWTEGATGLFTFAIAIVVSVGSAYQAAASLSDPLFRWIVAGVLVILCLGGLAFGSWTISQVLDPGGKPVRIRSREKTRRFKLFTVIAVVFLATDVALNLGGFFAPMEHNPPDLHGGATLIFEKQTGERLQAIPVRLANYATDSGKKPIVQGLTSTSLDNPSIELVFEFRKRERVKELVIRDATVTVLAYEEAPIAFQPLIQTAAAGTVPETIISFSMSKKREPLPWTFKPTAVKVDGEVHSHFLPISTTDSFTNILKIKLCALDPGIYKISVKLDLNSDFHAARPLIVPDEPVTFLFAHPSHIGKTLKPGTEVMVIDYGGQYELRLYEDDNPYFPIQRLPSPSTEVPKPSSPKIGAEKVPPRP